MQPIARPQGPPPEDKKMTVEKTDDGKVVLMDPKAELAKMPDATKQVLMTSIKGMPD